MIFFIALLSLLNVNAKTTELVLGIPHMYGSISAEKKSLYEKKIEEVYPEAKIVKAEYEKIKSDFQSNKIDCIFPIDKVYFKEIYPGDYKPLFSKSVFETQLRAIFLKNADNNYAKKLEELKGMRIISSIVWKEYIDHLNPLFENDYKKRIQSLRSKTADVSIEVDVDLLSVLKDKKGFVLNKEFIIKKFPQYILCKSNTKTKKFLKTK